MKNALEIVAVALILFGRIGCFVGGIVAAFHSHGQERAVWLIVTMLAAWLPMEAE